MLEHDVQASWMAFPPTYLACPARQPMNHRLDTTERHGGEHLGSEARREIPRLAESTTITCTLPVCPTLERRMLSV